MPEAEMTENQKRFVREYVVTRNATTAYLRAFSRGEHTPAYSTARNEGAKLLADHCIANEIEAASKSHARDCGIRAKRVLRELAAIAFLDLADVFEEDSQTGLPKPRSWSSIPPAARRAIAGLKVKARKGKTATGADFEETEVTFQFCDKLRALERLADHLGLMDQGDALHRLLAAIEQNDTREGS